VLEAEARHSAQEPPWQEFLPLLDDELNRLPEKYRVPLVLVYLKGKAVEQAARELDWPQGTVACRLARGKEMLRCRLTKRGRTLSAAMLATLLSQPSEAAILPGALVRGTLALGPLPAGKAAISIKAIGLADGVLRAMFLTQIKLASAVVVTLVLMAGGGTVATYQVISGQTPTRSTPSAEDPIYENPPAPSVLSRVGQRVEKVLVNAQKEIEGMDNWYPKVYMFVALAEMQIKFSDRQAALASCEKAAAVAETFQAQGIAQWQSSRDGCLGEIAPVQASAGDVEGAIKLTRLGTAVASRLVKYGRIRDAQQVASRIEDKEAKDSVLVDIALAPIPFNSRS
jgi:hypothetical protein